MTRLFALTKTGFIGEQSEIGDTSFTFSCTNLVYDSYKYNKFTIENAYQYCTRPGKKWKYTGDP